MSDYNPKYAAVGGPPWNWYEYKVLRENGEEVKDAISCDAQEGYVMKYVRDENGNFMLTEDKEHVVKDVEYGKFNIVHKNDLS